MIRLGGDRNPCLSDNVATGGHGFSRAVSAKVPTRLQALRALPHRLWASSSGFALRCARAYVLASQANSEKSAKSDHAR